MELNKLNDLFSRRRKITMGYYLTIIVSKVQLFMRDSIEAKRQAKVIGGTLQWIRTILFA